MATTAIKSAPLSFGRIGGWSRHVVWLSLCLVLWVATASASVDFQPRVSAGIAVTDNLELSSSNPESETVLLAKPSFTLTQKSPRLTTNVAYQLDGFYYWNRDIGDLYHQFDGETSLALDPDNFFLQMGATRTQTIIDPAGPVFTSNLPISANRTNRDDYYIGPMFRYQIGSNITAQGDYRRTWLKYDYDRQNSFQFFATDFETDQSSLSLDNYRRRRGVTWAVRANSRKTDYHRYRPLEFRQASLELGVWVSQNIRIFATGGKESAWDDPFDPSLEDNFWEAGFSAQVGRRLRAEVAAGERTFGKSGRASVDFTLRHGQMTLSYAEEPTTQGRDNFNRLLLPSDFDNMLSRVGSVQRYLSKRFNWSLTLNLRRTDFNFAIFNESREDRIRIDGFPLPDQSQRGANFSAKWKAGARTTFGVSAYRSDWDYAPGSERQLTSVSLSAEYQLGSRTSATLDLRHMAQKPKQGLGRNYDANILSLLLTRTF